jgi:type III pantothenate kinase
MLLVMDVGNTTTMLGVYDGERRIADWRLATLRERTVDEYGVLSRGLFSHAKLDLASIDAIVISSVVPPLNPVLEEMSRVYFGHPALFIEPGVKTGMPVHTDNPHEVGADRIVNGVAAFARFGGPLIVIDFGTATTFDVISAKGEYLGGAIAPGLGISSEALFDRAARLPRVAIRRPSRVVGRNTVQSMQSGLFFGYAGLVEGIVNRMREELGEPAKVIATGGLLPVLASELPFLEATDPYLTLEGLRLIYQRNL